MKGHGKPHILRASAIRGTKARNTRTRMGEFITEINQTLSRPSAACALAAFIAAQPFLFAQRSASSAASTISAVLSDPARALQLFEADIFANGKTSPHDSNEEMDRRE
jgi:hypothetical protein